MQQTLVCPHGCNERTLFPTSAEHISAPYNADCVIDSAHYYPSLTSGTALIFKLQSAVQNHDVFSAAATTANRVYPHLRPTRIH